MGEKWGGKKNPGKRRVALQRYTLDYLPIPLARFCDQSGRTSDGRAPQAVHRSRRMSDGTSTDPVARKYRRSPGDRRRARSIAVPQ